MTKVMEGIRVLEVASWTFVPAAGAVLADWGADVIKVEHPERPDPQRGHRHAGMHGTRSFIMDQTNRGKRSIGINMATSEGRSLLYELVRSSDVFLTNFLPAARQKLRIDVEHLRSENPDIVYARGSGMGVRGPEADRAGYDGTAYVARSGFAAGLTPPQNEWPIQGTAAVGDLPGAMTIAGGISAALFHRERTGVAPIVDISLLAVGMWTMSPDIVSTKLYGLDKVPRPARPQSTNPISITYRTRDGRFIKLSMFESDRFFGDLVEHLDCSDLATDERFDSHDSRAANSEACVQALDDAFGRFTLAELRERFETLKGAWGVVQTAVELHDDRQAIANNLLMTAKPSDGSADVTLVAAPVQFDETPVTEVSASPDHGEHTDEILLELGYDWDQVIDLKVAGAVL